MTVRRKSFGTPDKPVAPLEIEVNGEVFNVNTRIPGAVLLDFMEQIDVENPQESAKALRDFFTLAIPSEEHARWETFVRDPQKGPDLELLSEVAGYLIEQIGGGGDNPTQP
jgi:hypothetical protein